MRAPSLPLVLLIASCDPPESRAGLGLDLQLRVAEAQLHRGTLSPAEDGPAVTQVLRPQPQVRRGEGTVVLRGRLGPSGVALHLHAIGDRDHWVVAPRGFDFVVTDELLFDAQLQFSPAIARDRVDVQLQAADADGRLGPITTTHFDVLPDVPPAQLVVTLGWDAPVDLDLHVENPDGSVVGAKDPTTLTPSAGEVLPPEAWTDAGVFEFDSNQGCRLDLRNRETVSWVGTPPPGTYRVYAHLFSACDREVVNFSAVVQHDGRAVAEASSTQYAFDAREHPADDAAPGLLLLEFDVP